MAAQLDSAYELISNGIIAIMMRQTSIIVITICIMLLSSSSLLAVPSFLQGALGQELRGNLPPTAIIGPDQRVNEGDHVTLDGSGSFDQDGEIVTYAWGLEDSDDEAPPISLNGWNTSIATFNAPMVVGNVDANSYLFELTVTDSDGMKGTNSSKVVVLKDASQ